MKKKHGKSITSASPDAKPTSSIAGRVARTALPELDISDDNCIFINTGEKRNSNSFSKGDILDDRFMLVDVLGSEGISIAYKAIDKIKSQANKEHFVTIKVLKRRYQSNSKYVDAFAQAARKCQALDHPNIAKVYGFHCDGGKPYLHMEYLHGESLGQKTHWGVKQIPVKETVQIVNKIGHALAYAHERGVIHDDLKPANIFLTDSNEVKVIDFSITQELRRTAKDDADLLHFEPGSYSMMSPSYASPELLELKIPDPRDDVYALACIAYELLAGHHPFERVRATVARNHGVELMSSEAFTRSQWNCLQQALAFERDARTPTVEGFLSDFNASTKWAYGVSLAAGVVFFCMALGYLIQNQMPVSDWPVAPEMVSTPSASQEIDQTIYPNADVGGSDTDELKHLQSVTTPTKSEVDWLRVVENKPDIQLPEWSLDSSVDIDESNSVQPLAANPPTATQSKGQVLEKEEFAAITDALPEAVADQGMPSIAGRRSPDVNVQSSRDEVPPAATKIGRTVVINEFMALNSQTVTDAQGGYDDWIELYNWSLEPIDLSGYYLSDNPEKLKQWRFPDGTEISPTSYLLIWADRTSPNTDIESQSTELHANFDLSDHGEQILLVDSDKNGNAIIDRISFGRQHENSSIGRSPNGFGKFERTHSPTPGWSNTTVR